MGKYQKTIEAVQWTGDNFDELKEIGKSSIMCDFYNRSRILKVKDQAKIDIAEIGDYVIFHKRGFSELVRKEQFEKEYLNNGYVKVDC